MLQHSKVTDTSPCYMCFGVGGGCNLCECCEGKGEHQPGQQPTRCRQARRNCMGKDCPCCGAPWDEECAADCVNPEAYDDAVRPVHGGRDE